MTISEPKDAGLRPAKILHITEASEYTRQRTAGGEGFVDPSLEAEGFIHCSTIDQFLLPANERFSGRDGLVLLVVDVALLTSELIYEDCYESGMEFPHVYGPIDLASIVDVVDFEPASSGRFEEPADLRARMSAI